MNIPADKYNVAWFKLAECVSRREKERALGVYRLLAHSFDDKAFACQLEADIFSAFDDTVMAKSRYDRAIMLYKKEKRFLESAAVTEHMHFIYPNDRSYLEMLIDVYGILRIKSKVVVYLGKLVFLLLADGDTEQVVSLLTVHDKQLTLDESAPIRQRLVYRLLQQDSASSELVLYHIKKTVDGLVMAGGDMALQQFLSYLQELNADYFLQASEYAEQDVR